VRETRERILAGAVDPDLLVKQRTGEIKAQILERDGQIIIEKTCAEHGTFTDVLAINPDFLQRIERLFPGRDYRAVTDRSTITARRPSSTDGDRSSRSISPIAAT
jgi:hypothetical protein